MTAPAADPKPDISILVGLACEDADPGTIRLLESLRSQQSDLTWEVIMADRRCDELSRRIDRQFPQVRRLPAAAGTPLPALRAMALREARADTVAVISDHCIPGPGWMASLHASLMKAPEDVVAVGGTVVNSAGQSAAQRAAFTLEYAAFLPPGRSGPAPFLPGMNIAYRRSALERAATSDLGTAFWENFLHPRLLQQGGTFISQPEAVVTYARQWTWSQFAAHRFTYSRYYAGTLHQQRTAASRLLAASLRLLLPLIILGRHHAAMRGRPADQQAGMGAWPYLLLYAGAATTGEIIGILVGPGGSLSRIA